MTDLDDGTGVLLAEALGAIRRHYESGRGRSTKLTPVLNPTVVVLDRLHSHTPVGVAPSRPGAGDLGAQLAAARDGPMGELAAALSPLADRLAWAPDGATRPDSPGGVWLAPLTGPGGFLPEAMMTVGLRLFAGAAAWPWHRRNAHEVLTPLAGELSLAGPAHDGPAELGRMIAIDHELPRAGQAGPSGALVLFRWLGDTEAPPQRL